MDFTEICLLGNWWFEILIRMDILPLSAIKLSILKTSESSSRRIIFSVFPSALRYVP